MTNDQLITSLAVLLIGGGAAGWGLAVLIGYLDRRAQFRRVIQQVDAFMGVNDEREPK